MAFQWPDGVLVPTPSFQNWASVVSAAVRVVLLTAPRLSTWLTASAHCWLVRAGGPAGSNWLGLVMANGVRLAHCGSSAGAYAGAVGCQSPAAVPGSKST